MYKLLLFFILTASFSLSVFGQDDLTLDYTSVTDDATGLKGLKFRDEIILLPQFEDIDLRYAIFHLLPSSDADFYQISDVNSNAAGIFSYKENGKWGMAFLYGRITDPVYDSITKLPFNLMIVENDGKYGLSSIQGIELLPTVYDAISGAITLGFNTSSYNRNLYFIVKKEGKESLIDMDGYVVVENYSTDIFSGKKLKNLIKSEDIRLKNTPSPYNRFTKEIFKGSTYEAIYGFKPLGGEQYEKHIQPRYNLYRIFYLNDGQKLLVSGNFIKTLDPQYDYVLPQSDRMYIPVFKYSIDGKWGLMNADGKITDPVYNDIDYNSEVCVIAYSNDGDYLLDMKGNAIMGGPGVKIKTVPGQAYGYYMCEKDGIGQVKAINGDVITEYRTGDNKAGEKARNAVNKYIADKTKSTASFEMWDKAAAESKKYISGIFTKKGPGSSRVLYPGSEKSYGVITDFGLSTGILTCNTPYWMRKRNPNSVVAEYTAFLSEGDPKYHPYILTDNIEEAIDSYNKLKIQKKKLAELVARFLEEGYDGTTLYNNILSNISSIDKKLTHYEKEILSVKKVMDFNAKVDAISGSILNILDNAMAQYEQTHGTQDDYSPENGGFAGDKTLSGKSSASGTKKTFDLSTQQDYNVAKKVYSNYESQLMKMKTYPDKYDKNQKELIQKKMCSLREKWESQGKDFPRSSMEDW